MKGIIFNVVEEAVSRSFGIDTWETLLGAAEVAGIYSAIGDYPSRELVALVDAAALHLGLTAEETWRWVGEHIVPLIQERYPQFFDGRRDSADFLSTIETVVHDEVRKLYEGARPPRFVVEVLGARRLMLTYHSQRGLADLVEGIVLGVATLYGEYVLIERSESDDGGIRLLCGFTTLDERTFGDVALPGRQEDASWSS